MDGSYYSEPFDYPFPYTGSTLIYDLDSDGDLEVFSGTGEGLAVFDIKELGVSYGYWNIFRGNFKRDGYFRNINYGDLNTDDNIDIFDIIIMVNFILGESESINYEYADINHDGHVDISDIILILNYILLD